MILIRSRPSTLAFVLLAITTVAGLRLTVSAQNLTFKIPPLKTSVNIENQPVAIIASGMIAKTPGAPGENIFRVELDADLTDLQQNFTNILRAELDKNDRCGERIAIQRATLAPANPSSVAVTNLHFEKWACVKVFGKQKPNKLVGGNGMIEAKLTPAVDQNQIRLVPEVGRIEADGSLGELLRSREFGERLREKIRASLLSAMQKGTDFNATLPPAVQPYVSIQHARFRDTDSGGLSVEVDGQVRLTHDQIQLLRSQLKERIASH
jgi:hypothetical protein